MLYDLKIYSTSVRICALALLADSQESLTSNWVCDFQFDTLQFTSESGDIHGMPALYCVSVV